MINYDGKVRKERKEEENPQLRDHVFFLKTPRMKFFKIITLDCNKKVFSLKVESDVEASESNNELL